MWLPVGLDITGAACKAPGSPCRCLCCCCCLLWHRVYATGQLGWRWPLLLLPLVTPSFCYGTLGAAAASTAAAVALSWLHLCIFRCPERQDHRHFLTWLLRTFIATSNMFRSPENRTIDNFQKSRPAQNLGFLAATVFAVLCWKQNCRWRGLVNLYHFHSNETASHIQFLK